MWDKPLIYKELEFVYLVNGKKFLSERKAEMYVVELEIKEIEKRLIGITNA